MTAGPAPGRPGCGTYGASWMKRNSLFTRSGTTTIRPPSCGNAQKSAGPLKPEAIVVTPDFLLPPQRSGRRMAPPPTFRGIQSC